jgi:transposase-like protein
MVQPLRTSTPTEVLAGLVASEAETFWSSFLKSLARRGLRGIKLVISDAHEGLKAAIRRVFGAAWQRCRVHWMRNALAHVPKTQQSMVAAALRQAFLQPTRAQASAMLRHVAVELAYRTFDKIQQVDQGTIADNKRLGAVLAMIRDQQLQREPEHRSTKAPRRRDQQNARLFKVG